MRRRERARTGDGGREGVEHGLGVQAGGQALVLGGEGGQGVLPAAGQVAADDGLVLAGLLRHTISSDGCSEQMPWAQASTPPATAFASGHEKRVDFDLSAVLLPDVFGGAKY